MTDLDFTARDNPRKGNPEIILALDDGQPEEDPPNVIIADITRDDAWLTVPLPEAAALHAWR
jgi:hypothetical protein